MKILAINGSYRKEGFSNAALEYVKERAEAMGAEFERIDLTEKSNIAFCTNCRECMQKGGQKLGRCRISDDMGDIVEKIEAGDRYIFISPTNFFTVTAIFKRFTERLCIYGYWPWGAKAPECRRAIVNKKALCITSAAMPSCMAVFFISSLRVLKTAALTIGAKPLKLYFMVKTRTDKYELSDNEKRSFDKKLKQLLA